MNMSPSESTPLINIQWLLQRPWRLLAFGFGCGLSRLAPGTVGTLWAWAIALVAQFLLANWSHLDVFILLFAGFLLGVWSCGNTGADLGIFDHSGMVWDEIIAFWLILFFIFPANWKVQLIAFILFRFFDIAKPGPIRYIDAYFKTWLPKGFFGQWPRTVRGFGVMIDDLLATFFTLLVLSIFSKLGLIHV
jgi:phosphatidylglycerophosphatase A